MIAGALASYLLGDSVTQFSTIIGVYLFSMGIGSYLSKFIHRNLIGFFVRVEILVGLVGGCSAAILFLAFESVESFRVLLYSLVSLTGILVGIEIPILMRILQDHMDFKDLVSRVFAVDYIGALIASLLFPLVLMPYLGLMKSGFFFGALNVSVALWTLHQFRDRIPAVKSLRVMAIVALLFLGLGFSMADEILSFSESLSYRDKVIYSKTTRYQRLVLTKSTDDVRLFLNGNLQFSSADEYRYHEPLVHVGLATLPEAKSVLILGGGDGLAAREVLKYPHVQSITLVDLDPLMTKIFSSNQELVRLNQNSLLSKKLKVINEDAFIWLRQAKDIYDYVIIDFPDPSNYSIGKLYSNTFYRELKKRMSANGVVVVQSTSPYVAKKAYWCVVATLQSEGFLTTPYHVYVPSFGEWGFILGHFQPFVPAAQYPTGLKFVSAESVPPMFVFPEDMKAFDVEVNKLNNQSLVRYFEAEWSHYLE